MVAGGDAAVAADTWDVYKQVKLRDVAAAAERVGESVTAVSLAVHRVNGLPRAEYEAALAIRADAREESG